MSYLYSFVVYLYVNGSGSITSVGEERANLSAVVYCNYVVSVWRGFLFLWVPGMGYVILLWHFLSLPYNYFILALVSILLHIRIIETCIKEIGLQRLSLNSEDGGWRD